MKTKAHAAQAYSVIDEAAKNHPSDPFWADRMKSRFDNGIITMKDIIEKAFE
jgi:hypothetical protein